MAKNLPSSYLTVQSDSAACSIMGGGVPTQIRVFSAARICPFKWYLSTTYPSIACTKSSLILDISKSPSNSTPTCSNQNMGDDDPWILLLSTQVLYIVLIGMYYAILLCHLVIYYLIGHNPISSRSPQMCGYKHIISRCLRGCLSVIQWANRLWNLPSSHRRWGDMNHIYELNSRT